jgi:hypothetical protein
LANVCLRPIAVIQQSGVTVESAIRAAPVQVTENPGCQTDTNSVVIGTIQRAEDVAIKNNAYMSGVRISDIRYDCTGDCLSRRDITESLRSPIGARAALSQSADRAI